MLRVFTREKGESGQDRITTILAHGHAEIAAVAEAISATLRLTG